MTFTPWIRNGLAALVGSWVRIQITYGVRHQVAGSGTP